MLGLKALLFQFNEARAFNDLLAFNPYRRTSKIPHSKYPSTPNARSKVGVTLDFDNLTISGQFILQFNELMSFKLS